MDWGPVLLCGWPGLPGLWYRGQSRSLLVAVGFSILLNLALVSSFLWPWSLGKTFPLVAWPVILLVWVVSAGAAYKNLPDLMAVEVAPEPEKDSDTLFIHAQREYLKGHWSEAESVLQRCLDKNPRDIEARLLLATLYRHTRHFDRAAEELDTLLKFDPSARWLFEIRRERELIESIVKHEPLEPEQP